MVRAVEVFFLCKLNRDEGLRLGIRDDSNASAYVCFLTFSFFFGELETTAAEALLETGGVADESDEDMVIKSDGVQSIIR